ncbi:protein disulfide isomerase-like 1-6 [Amborella trichopoda]|uniref:protein disulfide-isomerase n=1 Tax=Amborella trichopoda TaxID=13333 RepID=W1NSD6_AMBTC|nr:protein disulfide isomerase-like 1-6 [Amborella trichopoda]ERM98588.1 hypothetical protein AMTR_s00109p00050620 [Amborella trichopoda]|eukprot:XP_006833310.1 protein disulfide isomerase-like 1-6 [Amborella trichopoda]
MASKPIFFIRPNSPILMSFFLFLILSLFSFTSTMGSEDASYDNDLETFEELLAAEEELQSEVKEIGPEKVSRAQKIVMELNNDNSHEIVHSNEYVFLLGYAPWCGRSQELMPNFSLAATTMREMENPVVFVKLDAERYTKVASSLGIKGFPTLLFFVNGSAQLYNGGFTSEEMVIWVRKRTGMPVINISSVLQAEEFIAKHQMFLVGLFEDLEGSDHGDFVKAAIADNEIQFVETSNVKVAEVLYPDMGSRNHFLGFVKGEPEKYVAFEDEFKEEKILQFVETNKFPLVTVMTELNSAKVYSSPFKRQVFIFAEPGEFKKLLGILQDVARKFKSKIMFIYVDSSEDDLAKPILTIFGLEPEEPIATAFDYRTGSKYVLESDLTISNLEGFCFGLVNSTLPPYFKSEPPVPRSEELIQKVVGKTFDAIVLSSTENVLLEVYTPWCANCEATSKKIEKLAKHFKRLQDKLLFARIDASANEHPKLQIDDYPTLLFYPSGDKMNPIKLSTKSSSKDWASFINKRMKAGEGSENSAPVQATKDEL